MTYLEGQIDVEFVETYEAIDQVANKYAEFLYAIAQKIDYVISSRSDDADTDKKKIMAVKTEMKKFLSAHETYFLLFRDSVYLGDDSLKHSIDLAGVLRAR